MGKKMFKLFMETMLRAAVIILAICIVIMLALLIKTINKNKKNDKGTNTTEANSTELSTETIDPEDPTFGGKGDDESGDDSQGNDNNDNNGDDTNVADVKSAKIAVINSTGTAGVAGSWKSVLESDGYSSVEVGNYLTGVNSTTMIYASGDYDLSDLKGKFNSPTTGSTSELDAGSFDVTISDFDIIIVVGTSDVK